MADNKKKETMNNRPGLRYRFRSPATYALVNFTGLHIFNSVLANFESRLNMEENTSLISIQAESR